MAKKLPPVALYRKFLQGESSIEELHLLFSYFRTSDEQSLRLLIKAELAVDEINSSTPHDEHMLASLKKGIDARIGEEIRPRPRSLWPRVAAAASIILAIGAGGYYLFPKAPVNAPVAHSKTAQDILPGSNKAYLTLNNGQRISLTDARNGKIASQAGRTIEKTADGKITYSSGPDTYAVNEIGYNTIETPRGGQYQIVLPDGSKAWLNAASSLRYPAQFTGNDREVTLTGEAYFEVVKDRSHPFRVKTDKQTVEVLGTHFNINSYTDEPVVKTTLLEGSVKITTGNQQRLIRPGEEAVLTNTGLRVIQADEEEVLSWKNGLFIFNDEPLESIMRKVSRWYDVDVQYGDVDRTEAFGGGVSRYSNVSQVLNKLESTHLVHFQLRGKVIYVTR